ncbi:hypothetical protein OAE88_00650 [bacterium]|nr:hypothetical protein [bacterium]
MWGSLFGTATIVEKGVDAVVSAGDKLFYTDEEKADMKVKIREHHLSLLKASEPFKVAQRLLAVWFSILFGIGFLTGLGMTMFNMITTYRQVKDGIDPLSIVTIDITPLFSLVSSFDLGIIMITICAFYFGGGTLNSFKGK